MAKQLMFSQDARQHILAGLSKLADAVKITMGPSGHNVILQKSFGSPRITKDGVIDPTKVVRCALENGSSVARVLLSTEVCIAEKPKSKDSESAPPDMGEDMDY